MVTLQQQQEYALLEESFRDDEENLKHTSSRNSSETFVEDHERTNVVTHRRRRCRCCSWRGCGSFLIYLLVFLLGSLITHFLDSIGHFFRAQVYLTEFLPAAEALEMQTVNFTGTAIFDAQGDPYFDKDYDRKYVGKPTQEIDDAWEELVKNRYFLIPDKEAKEAWGDKYQQYYRHPDGGYVAGLDVLHTLHCVNMLRMAIYKDYYPPKFGHHAKFQEYHIDHCIDIIRQSIQCHADLTVIPTKWYDGLGRDFIDSDQTHTCRNFEKVRQWNLDNFEKSGSDVLIKEEHPAPPGHEWAFEAYMRRKGYAPRQNQYHHAHPLKEDVATGRKGID